MRLFRWMKLVGLVLALLSVTPAIHLPFRSEATAASSPPPPRRTGDPDTPEWTTRPATPVGTSSISPKTYTWQELVLRFLRGGRVAV